MLQLGLAVVGLCVVVSGLHCGVRANSRVPNAAAAAATMRHQIRSSSSSSSSSEDDKER